MAQALLSTPSAGGENKQLFAHAGNVHDRPAVLNAGAVYLRGCLVYAADQEADFVKVANGALPAATDIIGIVADDVDATAEDTDAVIYVAGEFFHDTVFRASSDDLTAADVKAVIESCLHQGINIVVGTDAQFTPAT